MQRDVDDEPGGGAVAPEPRSNDAGRGFVEVPEDRVVGGVADDAGPDLWQRRGHDLGDLGCEDGIDRLANQEPDQTGARASGPAGGEVGGAGEAEAARQDDDGAEGA